MTVSLCVFHGKGKLRVTRRSLILPLFHFSMPEQHVVSFNEQVWGRSPRLARVVLSLKNSGGKIKAGNTSMSRCGWTRSAASAGQER